MYYTTNFGLIKLFACTIQPSVMQHIVVF